jgi:shikimate dehydrogenase
MSEFIKAGVIGHPIGHSKSPLIHNYWIKKYGLSGSYEAIDIAPEDLADGLKRLVDKGYSGFNFTIPHKELVVALCDEVDAHAQAIGAVNTVAVRDGKLLGMNTDGFGFIQNINAHGPAFDYGAGPAVVLGAGGAARAVIEGLLHAGAGEIILTNRTRSKAEALADDARITVVDWDARSDVLDGAGMLVNTTALGMAGQLALEIDVSALPQEALVTDIVYAPLDTNLLQNARAYGCVTVSGIGMLLHQARPAFEAWFGVLPAVDSALDEMVLT